MTKQLSTQTHTCKVVCSMIPERGKFRSESACHENDSKTNNEKFFYKHIGCWMLVKDSVYHTMIQFSAVQLLSRVRLFATPWTAAHQASLSNPVHHQLQRLLKLMSIEFVMPSNHLILCHPLPLLPSIFPSQGLFK